MVNHCVKTDCLYHTISIALQGLLNEETEMQVSFAKLVLPLQ